MDKKFYLTEDEKDKFYEYCNFDFIPKYNDDLFNDNCWLRRMCKIAKRADEYKQIKNFIKKNNMNIDFVSYVYLINNYNHNKEKDELLIMFAIANKD